MKRTMFIRTILVFIAMSNTFCHSLKLSMLQTTYEKGVKAYTKERWSECIKQFEESIHLYKLYKTTIENCRLKCNSKPNKSDINEKIGDLLVYEMYFHRKECLTRCHAKEFQDINQDNGLDETVLYNMKARKPYEYLHICYFQMYLLPKAASAAYTYLVGNPDDESMQANLNYYMQQPEVDSKEVVDLLSEDYVVLYKLGLKAYSQNHWADTVANMEEVLTDYVSSENLCRVECERQPEQQWSNEFSIGMSNNIAALLHCQQQCQDKLKDLQYNSGTEFIADILNYLQICYYRLDRHQDAAKAVATYLMMYPQDEDMLENMRIYGTLIDPKMFTVRSDIAFYFSRDSYEKKLLNLFHKGDNNTQIDSFSNQNSVKEDNVI